MLKTLARYVLRKLLLSSNGPSRIMRGAGRGLQMYGASVSNVLSLYEPHLQRIILRHVHEGSTVLDIGANTGFVTMLLARQTGPEGKVFAFEAIPSTFEILQRNVHLNALANVVSCQVAASNRDAELEFRVPVSGAPMASCYWHKEAQDVDVVKVSSVRLDSFRPLQGQAFSFVKIDVEGAEGDVIEGMQGILAACRPVIFIECSDIGRQQVWSVLHALDYTCYQAVDTLCQVTEFENFRHADFLWLPAPASP